MIMIAIYLMLSGVIIVFENYCIKSWNDEAFILHKMIQYRQ